MSVKNKMTDLQNMLMAQLEDLSNETLTGDELKEAIERAKASSALASTIIDSAKTEIVFLRTTGKTPEDTFFTQPKQIG